MDQNDKKGARTKREDKGKGGESPALRRTLFFDRSMEWNNILILI